MSPRRTSLQLLGLDHDTAQFTVALHACLIELPFQALPFLIKRLLSVTQKDHRLCVIAGSHRGLQKGDPLFPNFRLPDFCNCLPVGSLVTAQGHKEHRSFNLLSSEAPETQETHCVFLNMLFLSQKRQRCHKETRPVNHHICLSFLLRENFISIPPPAPLPIQGHNLSTCDFDAHVSGM